MPIISSDIAEALHKYDWLRRAYSAKKAGQLQAAAPA